MLHTEGNNWIYYLIVQKISLKISSDAGLIGTAVKKTPVLANIKGINGQKKADSGK